MSRQNTTIFANMGRGCRCGRQAFFDKCLSTFNRMAASSYMPPVSIKMTAFDFSKAVISGRDKLCCTTAFFLLPSCGSTCITSPPYYNLRDYGTPGQIGMEETPEKYIENLMAQGELLHGDGRNNHGQSLLPCHIRPIGRKGRHRHIQNSITRSGLCRNGNARQGIHAAVLLYDGRGVSVPAGTLPAADA